MFYVHDDILALLSEERVGIFSTQEALPFVNSQIGPGSIDLRLGISFLKFKSSVKEFDLDTSDDTEPFHVKAQDEIILKPGEIILANTLEKVFLSSNIGAILTGRSSWARLGLQINISQNFIQPGYFNTIPLQLVNLHSQKSIKIRSTDAICQIILFDASGNTTKPYSINPTSKYVLETTETEPSKLGIEFGVNSKDDFKPRKHISERGEFLIERFNKKLKAEAEQSRKVAKNYKNDEAEIGKFIVQFLGVPNISDSAMRTTFREDSIYKEIQSTLSETGSEISMLDVCCGYAAWIDHLEASIGEKEMQKIHFVGVDTNYDCIKKIRTKEAGKKFKTFNCEVREANSLSTLQNAQFDVILLTNSLHEIEPSLYPQIFEQMNAQVNQKHGKIIITDMEELPEKEVESIAINWTAQELKEILTTGGFECTTTRHEKEVPVFQAITKFCKKLDKDKMLVKIKNLLIQKRLSTIELLEHMESTPKETTTYRIQWLKEMGLIARISASVKRINAITAEHEGVKQ